MQFEHLDQQLRAWRAALHSVPELGYREVQTREVLERALRGMGLAPRAMAGTGLVVDLAFGTGGPCVAFRADMDALPFEPAADAGAPPCAVHACGHDMHSAILLGLAERLRRGGQGWRGSVKLIFQPAEEVLHRGSGAHRMVQEGVLRDPAVMRIYALHVSPRFPVGTVAYRSGVFMAESATVLVQVSSRSGHGAGAAGAGDPIRALSTAILALYEAFETDDTTGRALSFGRVGGGIAINSLPRTVKAEGTLRSVHPGETALLAAKFEACIRELAPRYPQLTLEFDYAPAYDALCNSAAVDEGLRAALADVVGPGQVLDSGALLASEDFSAYTGQVPGAMFLLGVRPAIAQSAAPVHSIDFAGSDDALMVGVRCLERIAIRALT